MTTILTPQLAAVTQNLELQAQITKAMVVESIGSRLAAYADKPGHLAILAMITMGQAFEICARGANAGDNPRLTAARVAEGLNDTMTTYEQALEAHMTAMDIDDSVEEDLSADANPDPKPMAPGEADPRD